LPTLPTRDASQLQIDAGDMRSTAMTGTRPRGGAKMRQQQFLGRK
jgi:hypothetical protein